MNLAWAAAGAAAGLLAGGAMRGIVFRMSVPSGEPPRSSCPRCAAPLRRWLVLRCAACGFRFGLPAALEIATAVVLALILGRLGGHPDAIAFAFFGALGVALAAIDIAVQRLPNPLTLPAYPVLVALLAVAALAGHDFTALGRALLGGIAVGGSFLVLALISPGKLGGGDVKLAGLAGLVLGWLGWPAIIAGVVLAFMLSAVVSLALLATRRVKLTGSISFGPFLLGGAVLASLMSVR
jgi:leader peptidase (prepilin peptidase) / N-methyltransferase